MALQLLHLTTDADEDEEEEDEDKEQVAENPLIFFFPWILVTFNFRVRDFDHLDDSMIVVQNLPPPLFLWTERDWRDPMLDIWLW